MGCTSEEGGIGGLGAEGFPALAAEVHFVVGFGAAVGAEHILQYGVRLRKFHACAEIRDAGGVAGVGDAKADGVFHPFVPDAVGVVGGGGDGVALGAKVAGEAKGESFDFAGGDRAEVEVFEFSIGAVDFEADAGADHDANDGVRNGGLELNGDADGGGLSGFEDGDGLVEGVEAFDGADLGAAIAALEGGVELAGGERKAAFLDDAAGIGVDDFAGVALLDKAAGLEPPDFIGEGAEEFGVCGGGEDDLALAAGFVGLVEPGVASGESEGGEIGASNGLGGDGVQEVRNAGIAMADEAYPRSGGSGGAKLNETPSRHILKSYGHRLQNNGTRCVRVGNSWGEIDRIEAGRDGIGPAAGD